MQKPYSGLQPQRKAGKKLFEDEFTDLVRKLSPARLLLMTVGVIFICETLIMLFIEYIANEPWPYYLHVVETLLDASLLSIIVFPVLYYFSFRPLRTSLAAFYQSQESLSSSRSLLEKTFSSLGEVVFVLDDKSHEILMANNSVAEVLGFAPEAVVGQPVETFFAGSDTYRDWSQAVADDLSHENHVRLETVLAAQGGLPRTVETTVSRILAMNGDPSYQVLLVRDVTQQRVNEEKIRLQTAALEAAANGIVITNRQGEVEWVNAAFCDMTGYATEEMVGRRLNRLKSGQHSEAFYDNLWSTILAGEVWSGETINRRKNGRIYTEEQTIAPVRAHDGAITHFIAIKQDISHRKEVKQKLQESETRYRSLVETSPDGILLTDMNGQILFSNEQLSRLLGAETPQALIGQDMFNFLSVNAQQQAKEDLQTILAGGGARNLEYQVINLQNQIIPVEVSTSVLTDHEGKATGLTSILRDITDRKQAEIQLAKQNQELQTLNRLSQEVVASLEMDVVLSRITQQVLTLLGAECLTILLMEDGKLVCRANGGLGFDFLRGQQINIDDEYLQPILAARRPHLTQASDCLFFNESCNTLCYDNSRALMLVPLHLGEQTIGLMQAVHSQQDAFNDEDVRLIQAAANWAAMAINNARQHTRIQRQLRETEALTAITQALNESLEMDRVLQLIADSAQTLIPPMEQVVIHLVNEEENLLTPVIWSGVTDPGFTTLFVDSQEGLLAQALNQQSIVAYPDLEEVKLREPQFSWSKGSLLVAPLIANGLQRLGTISIRSLETQAFSSSDQVILSRLASSAAIAIESSRLYQSERTQRQLAEALLIAAKTFNQSLQLDDVLEMVFHQSKLVVGYDDATFFWGEANAQLGKTTLPEEIVDRLVLLEEDAGQDDIAFLDQKHFAWLVQSGKPILNKLDQNKFLAGDPVEEIPETYAVTILRVSQKTLGFLIVHHHHGGNLDGNYMRRLEALSSHAALAIHNAQLYQDLQASLNQEQVMRQRLIQTEKLTAMGRMLASVAHEMNNPLQTIQNCLFISERRLDSGRPIRTYLEMATSETARLSDLVVQLRDVYRPRSSEDIVPIPLKTLLVETQRILQPHLQQHHIEWSMKIEDISTDCIIMGISNQLKQVLLNISLNAVDAMQPDGGELCLRTVWEKDGQKVGLELKDTGPGLESQVIPNLFEPFFTTKETGMGLGLAICYDIVRNHGGQISVRNAELPERGAIFTIWLPCNGR